MLKIKRLTETAKLPVRAYPSDAGLDMFSNEDVIINPRQTIKISTGIAIELPYGFMALNLDRSSLGIKGIHNFAGVIDHEYRGELFIVLYNSNDIPVVINKGDKISQLVIIPILLVHPYEVKELIDTNRGNNGFGSTGV